MTTYHLHNRFLNTLHPFPFTSRQAAEAFKDMLGSQDEIVERVVKVMDGDESSEIDEDLAVEDELDEDKYFQKWGT